MATHLALMNRDQVVTQAGLRLSTPQSDASIPITDHNHPECNLKWQEQQEQQKQKEKNNVSVSAHDYDQYFFLTILCGVKVKDLLQKQQIQVPIVGGS